jgi:OOP family OmpA-OmpF porin
MLRASVCATVAFLALGALAPEHTAHADTTQLGLWFGPRIYNADSRLGYIPDAPFHPTLDNAFEFGFRVGRPFLPWLIPELELAMAPASTNAVGGAQAASVFWLQPRLHLRLEMLPGRRFDPFLVVGGGTQVALSNARATYDTSVLGEGYVGAGVRVDTGKGFGIRLDARMGFVPGENHKVDVEGEVGLGLEFDFGKRHRTVVHAIKVTPLDRDGDGIPDASDQCPDRPEDFDGFEDTDGCPDIDNDLDGVLDIADKCPNVPETYNGFEDDDGCPDTVPPDVDSLRGTVEGLLYADGETVVRDSAIPNLEKIAKIMKAHPSIRVVLIGHTDNQEAKQFEQKSEDPSAPPPDLNALNADLSRARAEAVAQALGTQGIPRSRIEVEGHGADEPVSDNDKPRGRLANRRVEIKLYVPIRRGITPTTK